MSQVSFSHLQETVCASREACDRALSELMEISAVALEAIAKSRDLMAQIDAVIAK